MRCVDDCHTYEIDTFLKSTKPVRLHFYGVHENGVKFDGVTNEEVIKVLIHRIGYLNEKWQGGKFECIENELAVGYLELALEELEERTKGREKRGVEGTHEA